MLSHRADGPSLCQRRDLSEDLPLDFFDEMPNYVSLLTEDDASTIEDSTECYGITHYNANDYRVAQVSELRIYPNPVKQKNYMTLEFELESAACAHRRFIGRYVSSSS